GDGAFAARIALQHSMNSIAPQSSAAELVAHPHRLTLTGSVHQAAFPDVCPNCREAARHRQTVAKVFSHPDSDGPTRHDVVSLNVPYCDASIAAHRAQEAKPGWFETLRARYGSADILGAIFPGLAALFVARLVLGDLAHGRGTRALVELGIGG